MNTDHINYQQQIAQSVNEEKDHELIEKSENTSKQSSTSIGINPTSINDDYQRINQESGNNMTILTPNQRRERIFTLIIIALISLLTGKIIFFLNFISNNKYF